MEKDFHYHLIYSLAKVAGCNHPDIIAYASQFVDDNDEGQFSIDGEEMFFPDKVKANGEYYYPIMTQSFSPKSFDIYIQKYVYIPFHFLPGDNNVDIEGIKNKFSTTPNSQNARFLLDEALESGNPYQIGIALHTFADTWSHQNFTGLHEDWNSIYPWYRIDKNIAPNIGHCEAGHSPDVISELWTDYRFGNKINNQERAYEAIEQIYNLLRSKSGVSPQWGDVAADYKKIIETPNYDKRINAISDFLSVRQLGAIPGYNKNKWIDDALDNTGTEVIMKQNYIKTDWYKFHQAAKVHFAHVMDLIKDL